MMAFSELGTLLFGISPFDPITLGTSIAVVVAVSVAGQHRSRSGGRAD